MRSARNRRLAAVAAVVVLASMTSVAGLAIASRPGPPHINTAQFVLRSELGMDSGALNEAANAAIRADLRRRGLLVVNTTIYRTTIDGHRGTVTALVEYSTPNGSHRRKEGLTLIFYRSLWSLGQITFGVDPGLAN